MTLNRSAQFVAAAVLILTVYHKTVPISLYLFYKTRFDDGAKNDSCLIRFLHDAVFPVKAARKDRKKRPRHLERRFCFKALRLKIQKEAEEILFERRSSIRFKIRGTGVYGVCPFPLCMISISALH